MFIVSLIIFMIILSLVMAKYGGPIPEWFKVYIKVLLIGTPILLIALGGFGYANVMLAMFVVGMIIYFFVLPHL